MEKEVSAEGEWTTSSAKAYGKSTAIWCKAWYKDSDRGSLYLRRTVNGIPAYVLQVAPWHPQESARGKFLVVLENEGLSITQNSTLPKSTVPHIFDTLEEALAVYDLITEKD